ncbi:lysylphosphatidylglycerol synthase transmembrane domain-containing protein [Thermococcus sp.]|uniref:lysylphosphatidylglycerol synthase transmembrane domain-containing protein n=1 Tax=Thermococcus sp. TaxID=35749 RepID=UPI003446E170
MGKNIPLIELLKITLSSIFVNNVTPMSRSGGEILRITWIAKKHKIPVAISTVSILYERILEIFPIIFLAVMGIAYFTQHMLLLTLSLFFVAIIIWFKWEKIVVLSVKLFKIELSREELINLLSLKKRTSLTMMGIGLSFAVWLLDVMRLKLIALAFGWNPSIEFLAIVSLANLIFGLMAFTPGGIGIVEGGLIGTLTYFGIPSTLAVSITLIERFISYVISSIVGFVTLVVSGGSEIWRALKSH